MGRHSADAASGPPGDETGPLDLPAAYDSGTWPAIGPPSTGGKRRRMIVAVGVTLVGLVLLVFGFITLTSTDDPPSSASQDTATTPGPTPTSTATDPAATSATGSTPVEPATPVLPVTVLNASPDLTPGLATRVAEALETAGWPIAEISNFDATVIEQTTVYFTSGNAAEEAAAQALVAQFPEIAGGARPRFDGLGGTGLTVAAVGDWLP